MTNQPTDPMTDTISIQEGDRLIAEFDGWIIEPGMENDPDPFFNQPYLAGCIPRMVLVSEMKFHSSWDWLIPCLKTAKQKIKDAGWGTPTEKDANARLGAALNELYNLNIENTHFCLVKFIQWYNTNNSK